MSRLAIIAVALAIWLTGCAAPQGQSATSAPVVPALPKRIVAAISGEPRTAYATFGAAGVRGADALNILLHSGLATEDHNKTLQPILAESLPTVENRLWQVFPDGTMELTWRIREGARWHDGTPLTVDDLAFTAQVLRDKDLPFPLEAIALGALQDLRAIDAYTIRLRWNRLYINADRIFGTIALPLPKHLLETPYANNKGSFTELPYWSASYVGTGPYKVKEWEIGSYVTMEAFDGYALGRPKIHEIELRYVLDANVLVSRVLANDIDVTLGRNFSPDQGILVRQQWQDGRVDTGLLNSALNMWPQFVNPNPAIVGDVRFRRALYRALDRQTMADTLEGGLVPITHSWLLPNLPEYAELEHYIVKYDYDQRGAMQEIEALGYTRGPDGMFRDARGLPLSLELRSIALPDINERTQLVSRDHWQRAGVSVESYIVPAQSTDPSFTRNFPGVLILRIPADVISLNASGSSGATAMHGQRNPRGGYSDAGLDSLIERFESTIGRRDRLEIAGQIAHQMTDQLNIMTLFYDPGIGFVRNRLLNVPPIGEGVPWNAYQWDVR